MKMQLMRATFALVAASALFGATPAAAQERPFLSDRRAWLGFAWTDVNGSLVVQRVVPGSPADRAELRIGDLLVRIDGREATPDALEELGRTLEPGDTVRLDVRWDGRERSLDVVAARPPRAFVRRSSDPGTYTIRLDTLEHTIRAYLDSARLTLERVHPPNIRIERSDSMVTLHMGDEPIVVFEDSLGGHEARVSVSRNRLGREMELLRGARSDSTFRVWRMRADSLRDDARDRRIILERLLEARADDPLAPVILRRTVGLGRRAVAGAEFSEINPGLARYFGTDEGLLVLRVLPGTPAARAGLEAGDVIVRVGGSEVRSIEDLRFAVAAHPGPDPVEIEIVRDGERRTMDLENDEE